MTDIVGAPPAVKSNLSCDFALAIASVSGIPVFPCRPWLSKAPLTLHGFQDASTDPTQIRMWWTMWPDALIGVPTGQKSGIDILDIDPRHNGHLWEQEHVTELPETETHLSGGGGRHYVLKHSPGLRCSTSLIAAGVDIKGDGGYAIWWPAEKLAPVAEWPGSILIAAAQAGLGTSGDSVADKEKAPEHATVAMLIEHIRQFPNPATFTRTAYVNLANAVAGSRRGIIAHHGALSPADEDTIADAWATWAASHTGKACGTFADEREKWFGDWILRGDFAGWHALAWHGDTLGVNISADDAQAEFDGLAEKPPARDGLTAFLSHDTWRRLDIPPPDRLLGDLLTTTSRSFLVGRTGLGKTLLAVAFGYAIAAGVSFLHWHSHRAGRVLYIDGEMPCELVKSRLADEVQRIGVPVPPDNFLIFARDREEQFAAAFPTLGRFEPLNTPNGQAFVLRLIDAVGGVDMVIFDNVMSLVEGDQKDEIPWSATLPLVQKLTARRIGQVWIDHTGHDSSRQYGSSTKAWRFDSLGIITPLSTADASGNGGAEFLLSFDYPGKARRRTPQNWQDFAPRIVSLTQDGWTHRPATRTETTTTKLKEEPRDALAMIRDLPQVRLPAGPEYPPSGFGCRREAWRMEFYRTLGDKSAESRRQAAKRAIDDLKEKGLVGATSEWLWLASQPGAEFSSTAKPLEGLFE